jgi:hypothetical protein
MVWRPWGDFRLGDCWVIAGTPRLGDQIIASGKITKRSVDALISARPEGFLWDNDIKGFGARITKSVALSYVLQFQMGARDGKDARLWRQMAWRKKHSAILIRPSVLAPMEGNMTLNTAHPEFPKMRTGLETPVWSNNRLFTR